MPTTLKRTVARTTARPSALARRRLVVTMEPGDTISIREHGRRKSSAVSESIESIYVWMLKREADRKARARRKGRKK